jgi:hypothetical protein
MAIMVREDIAIDNYKNITVINCRDDLMSGAVRLALCSLTCEETNDMLDLLNSIANQGIKYINVDRLTYGINETKHIPIENMCSAEKLYILAYLAKLGKLNILIESNMLELEKDTLRDFFGIVNDLDNFIVLVENKIQLHIYQEAGGKI